MDGFRKESLEMLLIFLSCEPEVKADVLVMINGRDKKGISVLSVSFVSSFRKRALNLIQGTSPGFTSQLYAVRVHGRLMASGLKVQEKSKSNGFEL